MQIIKFYNKLYFIDMIIFLIIIATTWISFISILIYYKGDFTDIFILLIVGIIITGIISLFIIAYSMYSPSKIIIKKNEILFWSPLHVKYSSKFDITKIKKIIIRPKGTGKDLRIETNEEFYGFTNEFKLISTSILNYIEKLAKENDIKVIRYKWGEWP